MNDIWELHPSFAALYPNVFSSYLKKVQSKYDDVVLHEFEALGYDYPYILEHQEEFRVNVFPEVDGVRSKKYYHNDEYLFSTHEIVRTDDSEENRATMWFDIVVSRKDD